MRRTTILTGLFLLAISVAGCSSGSPDPTNPPVAETAPTTSGVGSGESAADDFPCNLLDVDQVATLITDPQYVADPETSARGEATCAWESAEESGDEVFLLWSPTDYRQATAAGAAIAQVGDEAFSLVINTNVADNTRLVVQNRLYVAFGDERFLLRVRSEQPDIDQMAEIARSIIDRCGSDCAPASAEASAPPTQEDSACTLLSDDEVAAITGVAATGEVSKSESAGCQWNRKVTILEVDAERFAEFQSLEGAVPVADVGDGAFYRREQLVLSANGQYWSVMSTAGTSADDTQRQATELGRLLASRL